MALRTPSGACQNRRSANVGAAAGRAQMWVQNNTRPTVLLQGV